MHKISKMTLKNYLNFIGWLFAAKVVVIAIAWYGWGFNVSWNGWIMPMWLAVVGMVVDAFISWQAFHFAKRG